MLCPVITGVRLHYMNSLTQPQTGAAGTLVAIVATMNVESPKLVLALLPYGARHRKFAVFTDSSRTAKIKPANIFEYQSAHPVWKWV